MLAQHRLDMLEWGAAVRLLAAGELAEVLPLDDAKLLEAARPIGADGRRKLDAAKVAQREDAMVRSALAKDAVAVLILGGSHDLTGSVQRVAGPACEYLRVTVSCYTGIAGN